MLGPRQQVHAEEARAHRANQAESGDHGEPHHGLVLPAHGIDVEEAPHILQLLADATVEQVEIEVLPRHHIELTGLRLVGDLLEPVAVCEAQEVLQGEANVPAEDAVGLHVGNVEPTDGGDEPIGEHVQGGFLEVCDEEKQEVLMPEAAKEPTVGIHEEAVSCFADDHKRVAGAYEARPIRARPELGVAVAIIAEPLFEFREIALRVGQLGRGTRLVANRHADQIRPRQ